MTSRASTGRIRLGKWTVFGQDLRQRWPVHRQFEIPPPLPE